MSIKPLTTPNLNITKFFDNNGKVGVSTSIVGAQYHQLNGDEINGKIKQELELDVDNDLESPSPRPNGDH
uniref:Uncharacterized protein n=1 Tax=Megaselia scalaris TaxID=36166 RepID=T1H3K8_MEGSC